MSNKMRCEYEQVLYSLNASSWQHT